MLSRTLLLPLLLLTTSLYAADDPRPVVDDSKTPVQKPVNPALPTIYIVGDSTANSNMPLRGWGSELAPFFDSTKINVVNRAIGGRSSRTFITEGRWAKVLAELKPGDFVLVQFGHNDNADPLDPKAKGRPSLHSDGDETGDAVKADGTTHETIHSFGWYMRKYSTDAQEKGASVFLLSMVPHKNWKDGKIQRNERNSYVKWTQADAAATHATFIDTNEIIAEGLEKLGPDKVEPLFGDPRTHSTPAGAKYNAAAVTLGLKSLPNSPFQKYLSPLADNLPDTLALPAATAPATAP